MQKIRCTSCDAKLKLPEGFSGDTVKCPRCGIAFSTAEPTSLQRSLTPDQAPATEPEPETSPPVEPSPDEDAVAETMRHAEEGSRRFKSRSAAFDFEFKRYWTPLIIRFSWFVVLIFAGLWIVFLSVALAGTFFGGEEQGSLLDTFGMSDLSSLSSLDIGDALSGKADVDSLNKFLDDVTKTGGTGSSNATRPPKSTFQSFMGFAFTTLSFLTLIASMILSVLFCRVFFETIIVLFDMSKTLKSIDQKSDLTNP